ncbi:MAG: CDP-diacylglycerol--glycerol-3-phosphate 3-phosphatidyltransferase [Candidatus Cloacimonadota bacterium]|nr:CDP-diacylglycerol--glycerol-3-phosphate 3-phosphatidyltransferase [Candidatus Cloacimonadota bacterium]
MKKYKHNIPNLLTILRIVFIPFFVYSALKEYYLTSMILFVFASLTDAFDGMIARKYNYVSNFGKMFDPLADKLLVVAALLIFVYWDVLSWWIVAIILLREIFLTLYRNYLSRKNIVLAANIFGKIKTTEQMVAIIITLVYKVYISFFIEPIPFISTGIIWLFYLAAFLSWFSAAIYLKQTWRKNTNEN